MKRIFKIIIVLVALPVIYYAISLLTMNNNFHVTHYYSYDSIEEAKREGGLINENVKYELKNFQSKEFEQAFKDNIRVWISKSNYQEFFGFLIHRSREDQNLKRITLESNKETDLLPDILFNKEVLYDEENQGSITYSSIDVFKKDKQIITLDIVQRIKGKPVKIGKVEFKVE